MTTPTRTSSEKRTAMLSQDSNKKKKRPRSRKNQTRQHICNSFLGGIRSGLGSGNWDLNPKSFRHAVDDEESPPNPLAGVVFDPDTSRYVTTDTYAETHTSTKDDDAIAQAMVVYMLYRVEKGWGNLRSFQALSVWMGKEPKDDDDDDDFPLENLWKQDMESWITTKQLGKTTMAHPDNWDQFPRFYEDWSGIWARRSNSMRSKLHELSEQACIQMAQHLSDDYSILAAQFLDYALRDEEDFGDDDMKGLADSLYQSALKGKDNFPKTAFDDLSNG